jgi:hypothetical protein
MNILTIFCDIDDFCLLFEPAWHCRLLADGAKHRQKREYYARFRKDTARATFTYARRDEGTVNPKPVAAAIKKAVNSDTPDPIMEEIRAGVYIMALCAGNLVSVDAPLEAQYLAAFQRLADFHGELILLTPEECVRFTTLVRADWIIKDAIAAFKAWQKGN